MFWSLVVAIISTNLAFVPAGATGPVAAANVGGEVTRQTAPRGGVAGQATAETDAEAAPICAIAGAAAGEADPPSWLGPEQPPEMTVNLLAEAVVDELPGGPAVIRVSHLSLAPATSGPTHPATGPVLFAVLSGEPTLYIDGFPVEIGTGKGASVQSGQLYATANETSAPATLLRLAILPPSDGAVEVAEFVPAAQISTETVRPAVAVLVQSPPAAVPASPARLFLACASWEEAGASDLPHQHPGPVGVWIERGTLALSEQRTLPTQGCAIFLAGESHYTRAGEPATAALLFGLLPETEPLWQPAAAAIAGSAGERFTCGDDPSG